jgi:UDP-N-acetylmuramate--alanine ligase
VTSELIGGSITTEWELVDRFDIANYLKGVETDVVVTFGAGNIDVICNDVAEVLKAKVNNN